MRFARVLNEFVRVKEFGTSFARVLHEQYEFYTSLAHILHEFDTNLACVLHEFGTSLARVLHEGMHVL